MDLINKIRAVAITAIESSFFQKIIGAKSLPREIIPAIDLDNHLDINDTLNQGDPNRTGITGSFTQNSVDKAFGGTGKLRLSQIKENDFTAANNNPIHRIQLTNGGGGYTGGATVTISGGGGSGATAEVIINAGSVVGINIVNGGSGFTSDPIVNITPNGAGSGATAIAYAALGGMLDGSLIQTTGPLSNLNQYSGEYEGTDIYKKTESESLVDNRATRVGTVLDTSGSLIIDSTSNDDFVVYKSPKIVLDPANGKPGEGFRINAAIVTEPLLFTKTGFFCQLIRADNADLINPVELTSGYSKQESHSPNQIFFDLETIPINYIDTSTLPAGDYYFGIRCVLLAPGAGAPAMGTRGYVRPNRGYLNIEVINKIENIFA